MRGIFGKTGALAYLGFFHIASFAIVSNVAYLAQASSHQGLNHQMLNHQTFNQWCLQRSELPEATAHTIQVLLREAQTDNCEEADAFLSQQTRLDLSDRRLSDLRPLAFFPQTQTLILANNQITDITPLGTLSQLQTLMIGNNQVQDLSGLSSLRQLETLFANDNQIADLDAIAMLPNLKQLFVSNNQLRQVPDLSRLTHLDLGTNQIDDVTQLSTFSQLIELTLQDNAITDISALSSLRNLDILDIRDNPLNSKACPVLPITTCTFSDGAESIYQDAQQRRGEGQYLAAQKLFSAAAQVYKEEGDRALQLNALTNMGQIYDDLGEYANALDTYEKALCIATLGRNRLDLTEQCDTGKTQPDSPMSSRQASPDPEGEAIVLARLGINRLRIGQYEKATDQIERALDIASSFDSIAERDGRRLDESFKAPIFDGLALAYAKQGQYAPSLKAAKLSLGHYRNAVVLNDRTRGEAIALNRVGQAYLNLGNLKKAKIYFDKALDRTQTSNNVSGQALSLDSLGDYFARLGQPEKALDVYQQARRLWQKTKLAAETGKNLNAIGRLQLELGEAIAAVASLEAAVNIWETLRSEQLTDQDKISLADIQSQTYQLLQQAQVKRGHAEAALEISEKGRARAFAQLLAHRLSLRGKHPPAASIDPPDIKTIKRIAREQNVTLVEYAIIDNALDRELYIWVIPPSGQITLRVESLEALQSLHNVSLYELIKEYRKEIEADILPPDREPDRLLYQLLIEPIVDLLPIDDPQQPVMIIPQRELFLVPFAALPETSLRTSPTLIDRHPLMFAPAISLLNIAPATDHSLAIGNSPALVIGNPTMPIPPNSDRPLSALQHAQTEAERVAMPLGSGVTDVLIGDAATEAAVRSKIETVNIAHFATHGLLDDFGTDLPGAIALAPTEDDAGFLTTPEIMDLSLAAQLVVLSACKTGGGTITGDGVVGLSRSFLTAGVDNVVVSLWDVNDGSTGDFMPAFYTKLDQGQSPAIALQQTMIQARNGLARDPSQWAAFSLFGQPSVAHRSQNF